MRKHLNPRKSLIERTIQVVAEQGLGKTTTKAVVQGTGINEAYIYRYFADKEDMMIQSFDMLDNELLETALKHVEVMNREELSCEARCRLFFMAVWRFMLSNRNNCIAFIRFYYSVLFKQYCQEEHRLRYDPLLERITPAFRPEANVWMLLCHILNVMLDFAIKVFYGEVEDNDDTAEHVFRLVYYSVSPYFTEKMGVAPPAIMQEET